MSREVVHIDTVRFIHGLYSLLMLVIVLCASLFYQLYILERKSNVACI